MTYPSGPANSGYPPSPGPLPPTPDTSGQFRLADMAGRPPRKMWPWITAVVVVLVLAAGAVAWFLRPEAPVGSSTKLTLASASTACQEKVIPYLKAPGTAKFGGEEYSTRNVEIPVRVSGWVDAENSFGALVRNRYSCLATPTEHGWSVGDVTFSDW